MTRILRVDSSARTEDSLSRELAGRFLEQWLRHHPGNEPVVRDLVRNPVPPIAQETIAGFHTPADRFNDGLLEAVAIVRRVDRRAQDGRSGRVSPVSWRLSAQ